MIEFKQIIGRATRTFDGKDYFTIWDFVKAHENFEDPEWDGPPLPPEGDPPDPRSPKPGQPQGPDPRSSRGEGPDGPQPIPKILIKLADGKEREIPYLSSTSCWDADGKPVSAAVFLERLFGDLKSLVADEDTLRQIWSDPDNREHFIAQLEDRGYDEDKLNDIRLLIDAQDSDLFDVLGYILFTTSPITRQARAESLRHGGLDNFHEEMKVMLLSILNAYIEAGKGELANAKLVQFLTARYGSVSKGKAALGELSQVKGAFRQIQVNLYSH